MSRDVSHGFGVSISCAFAMDDQCFLVRAGSSGSLAVFLWEKEEITGYALEKGKGENISANCKESRPVLFLSIQYIYYIYKWEIRKTENLKPGEIFHQSLAWGSSPAEKVEGRLWVALCAVGGGACLSHSPPLS